KHWLQCFAVMGVPQKIKTDNGSAYIAHSTQKFLQEWGIAHTVGVPGNSTGQAIIERAHCY
ncbi:POK18 protein, partial [Psophia crepitans]|nr:POK18 protein [Psophia crepitans]